MVVIFVGLMVYNFFVYGLILFFDLCVLVFILISVFCFWCWCGVLLFYIVKVGFEIFEFFYRFVFVVVDNKEFWEVCWVEVEEVLDIFLIMLFD